MVEFIAEVSSNHHRDLDRSVEFISTAARIGCDAVKFQLFRIDELFSPEAIEYDPEIAGRRQWELPVEFLPRLAARSRECGIRFSCTPFYLEAVEQLEPHVDFFKIASYELLWLDLLRACAATGKPVVLSTGMATLDEIGAAVQALDRAGCKALTLLHCVSGYPTPIDQCNLAAIDTLRKEFPGASIGWSDHSVSEAAIQRAVHRHGAQTIEFHLDLDGDGEEFGAGHCWLPDRIETVIRSVREGFRADGDGVKRATDAERDETDWRADPDDGLRPLKTLRAKLVPEVR